ncbi:MAG: hypothetical protein NC039_04545 [Muribaculaceae bacterium]|nr:hypothetical protein [Muribaculaceae bacterium]
MKQSLLFIALLLAMVSCSTDQEMASPENVSLENHGSRSVDGNIHAFDAFGEMHNMLLAYGIENFTEPSLLYTTEEERIGHVLTLQQGGVEMLPISDADMLTVKNELSSYKGLISTTNLSAKVAPISPATEYRKDPSEIMVKNDVDQLNMVQLIALLSDGQLIEEVEYDILMKLYCLIVDNANGRPSDAIEAELDNLISLWEEEYGDIDYSCIEMTYNAELEKYNPCPSVDYTAIPRGAVSGLVLNISKASLSYWNGEESPMQYERIAPWVGADAAGALVGAGSSLAYQLMRADGVNWQSVGWSALCSAANGSLGITARVGKFITGLF